MSRTQVYILQGNSGSGKSTWVRNNCQPDSTLVVSADHYFMVNGRYQFDAGKLGRAHAECLRRYVHALETCGGPLESFDTIVVDNTNTTIEEIAPYYALAEAYALDVVVLQFTVDPAVAAGRNVHGVPLATCVRMAQRLAGTKLPARWTVRPALDKQPGPC